MMVVGAVCWRAGLRCCRRKIPGVYRPAGHRSCPARDRDPEVFHTLHSLHSFHAMYALHFQ
jgi:hypothetical protein